MMIIMEIKIKVGGMSCAHCVATVTKALRGVKGVKKATVSLETESAVIETPKDIPDAALKAAIEGVGYTFLGRVTA